MCCRLGVAGEAENQLANIQDGQRQANKAGGKGQAGTGAMARKSGKVGAHCMTRGGVRRQFQGAG